MAKEVVNIEGLNAEKAVNLLGNGFEYPLEIDSKGKLIVSGAFVKVFLKFNNTGSTTVIKLAGSRWVKGMVAKILFVPFYWIYAEIKGLEEYKLLLQAVANSLRNTKSSSTTEDISVKLSKLKDMKDQGIISEEEFNKKKAELIEKL